MHLPRLLKLPNKESSLDMDFKLHNHRQRRKPRLDRRNAIKNIDYDAPLSSSPDDTSSSSSTLRTRSLDLLPSSVTSFRIEGIEEGEFDRVCRNLGLSGPEDFAIPTAAWEARKVRSSSDLLPHSRLRQLDGPNFALPDEPPQPLPPLEEESALVADLLTRVRVSEELQTENGLLPQQPESPNSALPAERAQRREEKVALVAEFLTRVRFSEELTKEARKENGFGMWSSSQVSSNANGESPAAGGIRGVRPPVLAPPPSMSLPLLDKACSTWDIVRSFAPEDDVSLSSSIRDPDDEEDEETSGAVVRAEGGNEVRFREIADLTRSCSFSTSNDDDLSNSETELMFTISPNGRFKRDIKSWTKGGLLGSGSFGTVYEGFSDDGFFFAVKEVSLLDQGSQAQQCITQLEQEITLLSRFEHENIVQYLGTDKEESKLYIFLELITKGSLASLYQKYILRDSQVSTYTRQILNGLNYLHDRKVMHRDIKCNNILVDATGSVKLADFGLAKETSKLNVLKSCKGSAYWMAPEVVNPRKTYGLAADIWSLGCTVLEMLTCQVPYSHLEWTQALFKIGQGVPPPIPNSLSKDARDFIHQCLQVEPDDRPSASKLLGHPFVRRPLPATSVSVPSSNSDRQT